jgi:hypothetical protein
MNPDPKRWERKAIFSMIINIREAAELLLDS